jgi:hypothetical protein
MNKKSLIYISWKNHIYNTTRIMNNFFAHTRPTTIYSEFFFFLVKNTHKHKIKPSKQIEKGKKKRNSKRGEENKPRTPNLFIISSQQSPAVRPIDLPNPLFCLHTHKHFFFWLLLLQKTLNQLLKYVGS